jgi:hypothetical protein
LGVADEEAAVRLALTDDALSIGGRLFSQLTHTAREDTDLDETALANSNIIDVYFDARPTERVRGYVLGRIFYSALTGQAVTTESNEKTSAALDQLWLKFDLGRLLWITFGQQPIRWGTGRFWNPTDFLQKQNRDPFAIVDDRVGIRLLKLHAPIEHLGLNFIGALNFSDAQSLETVEGAFRMEAALSSTEFALTTAMRKGSPLRVGGDISAGVFGVDLRLEGALLRGTTSTFWEGDVSFEPESRSIPTDYQRSNEWLTQYVVGVELPFDYGDQGTVSVGVEYFFNEAGYASADIYPWLIFAGDFDALHVGRQYLAMYATAPNPWILTDTTLTVTAMTNMTDNSWALRLDCRVVAFQVLTVNAFAVENVGRNGEFNLALDIPPQPGIPGFEAGRSINAPMYQLGLALTLSI